MTGPQSTTRPPAIQIASKRPRASRVRGEHEPRARVRRAQHAAEALEQRLEADAAALQPGGALVAALRRGRAGLLVDALEQRLAAVAPDEQLQRLVEPLAVEVRVEVVQARRQAAAHLPVGRRVLAARQRAAAVAQPEQRVELLDELGRRGAAAHRARRTPRGPAAGSRATSRIGNAMSSRQRR